MDGRNQAVEDYLMGECGAGDKDFSFCAICEIRGFQLPHSG
jgi:hypothetical protein